MTQGKTMGTKESHAFQIEEIIILRNNSCYDIIYPGDCPGDSPAWICQQSNEYSWVACPCLPGPDRRHKNIIITQKNNRLSYHFPHWPVCHQWTIPLDKSPLDVSQNRLFLQSCAQKHASGLKKAKEDNEPTAISSKVHKMRAKQKPILIKA